ncbi:MAG: ribonuclease R [Lachnospiraceae bacterium]|nr:ribonuclease R [Lachnospiraceae bacterium]
MGFEKSEEQGYENKEKTASYGAGAGSDAAPGLVTGVFLANKNGYGFVRPDVAEGEEPVPDIFIPASAVHNAFHMDRVEVRVRGDYENAPGERGKKHRDDRRGAPGELQENGRERRPGDLQGNDREGRPGEAREDGRGGGRREKKRRSGVPSGPKQEGEITKILSHGITQTVGLFVKKKDHAYVIPDREAISQYIYVDRPHTKGAVNGHKVVVRITSYGTKTLHPEGRVTEILGHADDPGTDILSVVKAYEIPTEFPRDVMEQTEKIPSFVSEEEMAGKPDLRSLKTVTIDGEDAKDLDDAITLERTSAGYRLGVHIADVSYYVTEGSPLDREALKRGTSVYLVDRVIHMLPHKLSNGICSLNEGEDRLALSCIMDLDDDGKIIGHEIAETVIRVDHRMSYTDVQRILELTEEKSGRTEKTAESEEVNREETAETDGTLEKYSDVISLFRLMAELSGKIRKSRFDRGAIDFDFPESKIKIDKKGRPVDVVPYERNTATDIIEDFMLMANETVAEDYFWQEVPFLYRTHEKPDEEKMRKMMTILSGYGYTMHPGRTEIHPKEIQKVLLAMRGTPEEPMLSRILLRSMKQAKYTPQCTGHFGLSARYYTHFTSPIRRYPDLQIHRIIRENLAGGISDRRRHHYEHILPEVGLQTSELERRADEAERETDKMKKAEYMMRHIGESYEGIISGVTQSGIYVELPNTVEGFIRISELKEDYFSYDRDRFELVGEVTNIRYRLGQKIRVTVADASKQKKTVDFLPAEEPEETDGDEYAETMKK